MVVMRMQVDEVARFVSDNARRVLGVDAAKVLPVSARAALQAKLDSTHSTNGYFGELLAGTLKAALVLSWSFRTR